MCRMMSETIYPLFRGIPRAYAHINGSAEYPNIKGMVLFYPYENGTVVVADIGGLPMNNGGVTAGEKQGGPILGFHIHEGNSCTGNQEDPFADAGQHYNPAGNSHPDHAGDLPPVLVNSGFAWSAVFTARFYPEEIIGKTVILHGKPDDFYSQPSGNAGEKIACGEIKAYLN